MRRIIILFTLLLLVLHSFGQETYFTRTGHIYFISKTDAIDIDANNYQVASFLDINTGKIQFAVLIKSFEFSLVTAKEHFNESYMESDKFPKATFKGEISDFEKYNFKVDGTYLVTVTGEIYIKEVTKNIEVLAQIIVKNSVINASSEFTLTVADFGIQVPKLVEHRVAKQIIVKVDMNYLPYKK